jgi:hypothetical protein
VRPGPRSTRTSRDAGSGQPGDGTTVDRLFPVPETGLSGIGPVEGGDYGSLAVGRDGAVRAWGFRLPRRSGLHERKRIDRPVPC